MASYADKNGKSKKPPKAAQPAFRFINHNLVKADEEWLEAAELETEFPLALMLELALEGYKVSIGLDSKNATYVASITDRAEGGAFYNACLTGRGGSPLDAWYAVAYRHFKVAEGDWSVLDFGERETPRRFS